MLTGRVYHFPFQSGLVAWLVDCCCLPCGSIVRALYVESLTEFKSDIKSRIHTKTTGPSRLLLIFLPLCLQTSHVSPPIKQSQTAFPAPRRMLSLATMAARRWRHCDRRWRHGRPRLWTPRARLSRSSSMLSDRARPPLSAFSPVDKHGLWRRRLMPGSGRKYSMSGSAKGREGSEHWGGKYNLHLHARLWWLRTHYVTVRSLSFSFLIVE